MGMPRISPATERRSLSISSSLDGFGSPLGWLCTQMMLDALAMIAGPKTSRGWTMQEDELPSEA